MSSIHLAVLLTRVGNGTMGASRTRASLDNVARGLKNEMRWSQNSPVAGEVRAQRVMLYVSRAKAWLAFLVALLVVLLLADRFCYSVTLPVEVAFRDGLATLQVGSQRFSLGKTAAPVGVTLASRDPVVHEYQIDGTDSTNNFTLDTQYLDRVASSPYYRFQAWMRDLDGTSAWRDLRVWVNGALISTSARPPTGQIVTLPAAPSVRVDLEVQRPETPLVVRLLLADGAVLQIQLDRNNHKVTVARYSEAAPSGTVVLSSYFPVDSPAFAAMVLDFVIRTLMWAILVMVAVMVADAVVALALDRVRDTWKGRVWSLADGARTNPQVAGTEVVSAAGQARRQLETNLLSSRARGVSQWLVRGAGGGWRRLTAALSPVALVALIASFIYVVWIALAQFHALPHIYDASAYLFSAKIYATGHLSVPIPAAVDRFPGPFMVQYDGRWFSQYPPGTSTMLAVGVALGVPWLVEPVLGTLALLGIGLTAARLYDRRIATVTVLLGALSPFYSYLAASYLSHAVALFFYAWGFWALVRFAQGGRGWNLPLAATLLGMAALTRDLVGLLFALIVVPGVLLMFRPRTRRDLHRWIAPGLSFVAVALVFLCLHLLYDLLLTGAPDVTPRALFSAADQWGFGQGIGFYGQHTLAGGFVTVDELLTALAIDLYGWLFYLTLCFLALPFLAWRARAADWLLLAGAMIMIGAFIGYFYHGIYLGPRYVFDTLPFLLMLTARGIVVLGQVGNQVAGAVERRLAAGRRQGQQSGPDSRLRTWRMSIATCTLVAGLIVCNLGYFTPRQAAIYHNLSGYPAGIALDTSTLAHPPVHHAIVVTNDYLLYGYTLFALNDPRFRGDVLYAFAGSSRDYQELRTAYPGRSLYQIQIAADGSVTYHLLDG